MLRRPSTRIDRRGDVFYYSPVNAETQASLSSPVKARFFFHCMLFFAVTGLLTIAFNLLLGFPFYFNYKWMVLSLIASALAVAARRASNLKLVYRIGVYLFGFVLLPFGWLTSAGLASPAIVYSLFLLIMINYLTEGRERITANALFVLLNVALISLYYIRPELFADMTPREQYLDWLTNVPLLFTVIAFSLAGFEKAYENERRQNMRKARELEQLSETDYLTGLYNRLRLKSALKAAEAGFSRTGKPFSLLLLDIDHFKAYNDHNGHIRGDSCLKEVAGAIRSCLVRESDEAFRFGGEEFLVLLPYTEAEGAINVAERVRTAVQELRIPHPASPTADVVTVSVGVTCADNSISTVAKLIDSADEALYRAKETGRNQAVLYERRRTALRTTGQ